MATMSEHMDSDRETIPEYIILDRSRWQESPTPRSPGTPSFSLRLDTTRLFGWLAAISDFCLYLAVAQTQVGSGGPAAVALSVSHSSCARRNIPSPLFHFDAGMSAPFPRSLEDSIYLVKFSNRCRMFKASETKGER